MADPTVQQAEPRGWYLWLRRLVKRQPERLAGFGGAVVLGAAVSIVLMYWFIWLADQVLDQETTTLDQAGADFVMRFKSPQADALAWLLSLMGSELVIVIGSLLTAVFLIQRRWGAAFMLVLVTGGVQLLNDVLKTLFHRTRPEPVVGWIAAQQYSFPSGHAMVSAAFYGYLGYLAWRLVHGPLRILIVVALTLLVLAIGMARIYLQAHYASDVLAGYICGLLWTDAVIVGSRLLVMRRERAGRLASARTVRA